jgi:hypothetical protein
MEEVKWLIPSSRLYHNGDFALDGVMLSLSKHLKEYLTSPSTGSG